MILEGRLPLPRGRVLIPLRLSQWVEPRLEILIRQTWYQQVAPIFPQSKRGDRISKGLVFEEFQPLVSIPEGKETKTKLYHRVRRLGE